MASTQAPLFGLDASGSIGGALTYAKWRGRTYVRVKSTPSNPRSPAQKSTRAMMRFLSTIWATLIAADQAAWDTLAAQENYSAFNAFVRYNMNRWTQWQTPFDKPTPTAGTVPVMGALTVTGGVGQLSLSQVITTANGIWGVQFALSATAAFTAAKTNIAYVAAYTASPVTAILTGLEAGTYYVEASGFTRDGDTSAFVAEISGVVT